jgi:hypothetical protein
VVEGRRSSMQGEGNVFSKLAVGGGIVGNENAGKMKIRGYSPEMIEQLR